MQSQDSYKRVSAVIRKFIWFSNLVSVTLVEGFMIETQLTVEFDHFIDKRYMRRLKIMRFFFKEYIILSI